MHKEFLIDLFPEKRFICPNQCTVRNTVHRSNVPIAPIGNFLDEQKEKQQFFVVANPSANKGCSRTQCLDLRVRKLQQVLYFLRHFWYKQHKQLSPPFSERIYCLHNI